MADKQNVTIIAFIVLFAFMTAFLATATVPEIYRQGEQINQTHNILNQTLLLEHEEEAFEKQSISENQERDKQRYLIINETNASIKHLGDEIKDFINQSEKRSVISATERAEIMNKLLELSVNLTDKIDNLTKIFYNQ